MTPEAKAPLSTRKRATPPTIRPTGHAAAAHDAAVLQQYQNALQLLQQARFEKALVAAEKLLGTAPPTLAERCRMYLVACHRELSKSKLEFASLEEQYDYAVSLLNADFYEEAREQFTEILQKHSSADYALYGVAVLDAITGQVEECLEALGTGDRNQSSKPPAGPHRTAIFKACSKTRVLRNCSIRRLPDIVSLHEGPLLSTSSTGIQPLTLRVAAIGGGTGLSTLLRGLRRHVAVPGHLSCAQTVSPA